MLVVRCIIIVNVTAACCVFLFQTLAAACGKFAPFEIKENVSLAPLCRVQREDSVLEELDHCLLNQADNWNGLKDWIGKKPRRSGPTKPRQSGSRRWEWRYWLFLCILLSLLIFHACSHVKWGEVCNQFVKYQHYVVPVPRVFVQFCDVNTNKKVLLRIKQLLSCLDLGCYG